jgi:hypothetical protein
MSFRTTLFKVLTAAHEVSLDQDRGDGITVSVPVTVYTDDTAAPPEVLLCFDSMQEQWTFHNQEIEVDEHGEAKVRDVDGEEHVLDFAMVRSLSAEDVS